MTALWSRRRDERGMTIVLALVVCMVVFTLGATWVGISMHQVNGSGRDKLRETARNAAEAGLNEAMSRLSADSSWTGETGRTLPGSEFEVSVLPTSSDPDDPGRYITAKGYAPSKASPLRVAKRLEQQIQLLPTSSFSYALFSAPGGLSGVNKPTITGDTYSATDVTLSNNAVVTGSVTTLGNVTTSNNTSIAGNVRAAGNVTLDNAQTTVMGNVYAGGNVSITGHVKGSVQAGGTITLGPTGVVDGSVSAHSPPPPPPAQTLPTFTWDPANYPNQTVTTYTDASTFANYWQPNMSTLHNVHYVRCPSSGVNCAVSFGNSPAGKLNLTADMTIVAEGPITISKDITSSVPVTLTIVSLCGAPSPGPGQNPCPGSGITMTSQVTVPDNVKLVLFAPYAGVKFKNLKHFTGTVYASSIQLDQQFQLTFEPVQVPGFEFDLSSSTHFQIEAGSFKEVPYS